MKHNVNDAGRQTRCHKQSIRAQKNERADARVKQHEEVEEETGIERRGEKDKVHKAINKVKRKKENTWW